MGRSNETDAKRLGSYPHAATIECLRFALECLPQPIAIVSTREGRVVETNQAARKLLALPGLSPSGESTHVPEVATKLQCLLRFASEQDEENPTCCFSAQNGEAVSWEKHPFAAEDQSMVVLVGRLSRWAFESMPSERLHELRSDPLTGLADRRSFVTQLAKGIQAAGAGEAVSPAVLFVDLDRFKEVNDRLGHLNGDEILRKLAQRIRHAVRPDDIVARFGGDEFTVLLEKIDSVEDAIGVAGRILRVVRETETVRHNGSPITVSVGIAVFQSGMVPEELLDAADRAMYEAKAAGGDAWAIAANEPPSPPEPGR